MNEYYFIGGDNKEYGPYSVEQIKGLAAENRLNGNSNMRTAEGDWKPAFTYPELGLQSGPAQGYQQAALNPQTVQQMVSGPATFMMVLSIVSIPLNLLWLAVSVSGDLPGFFDNLPPELREQVVFQGVTGIGYYSLGLIADIVILIGAVKMKASHSYELAITAGILSIIFHTCNCCCLGLGSGIWALVILSKPAVKAMFAQNKMMR
jgi:hypothetical protein